MPRNNLRSHLVGGSVAFAVLLIGSGAAWAQSGAGTGSTSGESGDAASSTGAASSAGASATGAFDATLSTNPLGITPQSAAPRSSNRRQGDAAEDAAVDGFVRNDGGLRFAPSFSASSNANANSTDLSARPAPRGRALGLQANAGDFSAQGSSSGGGRALGLNANSSDSVAPSGAGAVGNGSGVGVALSPTAHLSFFTAHVRKDKTAEEHQADSGGKGNANDRNAERSDLSVQENDSGAKGKAHGRNADRSDLSVNENGKINENGKKLGHAKGHAKEQFDESSIVQLPSSNPVITDAVAGPASPESLIIPAVLPAATVIPTLATSAVDNLSSPAMNAAPSPVPEPANWLLLALGLAALGGRALMRRGTPLR